MIRSDAGKRPIQSCRTSLARTFRTVPRRDRLGGERVPANELHRSPASRWRLQSMTATGYKYL